MKPSVKSALILLAAMGSLFVPPSLPAYAAQNVHQVVQSITQSAPVAFVKKKYAIKGDWQVVEENGQTLIRFSDDFKTKNGPDLKVFLSPQSIQSVEGYSATDGALLLGELTSNKGAQDYVLPAGVNLADFQSVLVHCEAFSVLWGGGALK